MKKKESLKKKKRITHAEMSDETSQRLLSAAKESFFANGFHGTSMDVLCGQVGLTRGALYHHFGSKEGLLEAVILQMDQELGKVILEEWNTHSDDWKGLLSCCELSLKMAMDPLVKKIYHTEGRFVLGERVREIDANSSIRPMATVLENLMQAGKLKKADPEILARQINALLMESAIFISESKNPKSTYALAIDSFRLIMEGLRTG